MNTNVQNGRNRPFWGFLFQIINTPTVTTILRMAAK